ncbi:putative zinc-binding protein [Chloroflexota bacterium]
MSDDISLDNEKLQCECQAKDIILLPCSGGSNCGQITNQVAVNLDVLGIGRIYCLAGIGAHINGMVESARGAKRIVALDGCQVACAKKTIEHAGLYVTDWICMTEEGIEKQHSLFIEEEDVERITDLARELLNKPMKV